MIIQRSKRSKRPLSKHNPPRFLYRGDDTYRGGPIGRLIDHEDGLPLDDKGNVIEYNNDEESQAAKAAMNEQRATEIEKHVTPGRKSGVDKTDRYTSFKLIRKGIAGLYAREHQIIKVEMEALRQLQINREIQILWAEDVAQLILQSYPVTKKKRHILAQNIKNGMIARQEILIEGKIPGRYINRS